MHSLYLPYKGQKCLKFLQLPEVPYFEDLKSVVFLHTTIPLMPLQRKSDELFLQDPR